MKQVTRPTITHEPLYAPQLTVWGKEGVSSREATQRDSSYSVQSDWEGQAENE